jgi:hypothetical protein
LKQVESNGTLVLKVIAAPPSGTQLASNMFDENPILGPLLHV